MSILRSSLADSFTLYPKCFHNPIKTIIPGAKAFFANHMNPHCPRCNTVNVVLAILLKCGSSSETIGHQLDISRHSVSVQSPLDLQVTAHCTALYFILQPELYCILHTTLHYILYTALHKTNYIVLHTTR